MLRDMLKKILCVAVCVSASASVAQEKTFTLQAPSALVDSGFMKHLLPRFSLKTGIRITISDENTDAAFGATGTPVFAQGDQVWHFNKTDGIYTDAFQKWLLSDVGKRTIDAFAPDDVALFSSDVSVQAEVVVEEITGDVVLGETVSLVKCGRCHVVSEANRMKAIGSTPSFALLRSFEDWQGRFQAFFLLKPHPAFTQVEDVTDPFPENLPSPIVPIEVTLDEIDAILAYVASMQAADLGAPLKSQ